VVDLLLRFYRSTVVTFHSTVNGQCDNSLHLSHMDLEVGDDFMKTLADVRLQFPHRS